MVSFVKLDLFFYNLSIVNGGYNVEVKSGECGFVGLIVIYILGPNGMCWLYGRGMCLNSITIPHNRNAI